MYAIIVWSKTRHPGVVAAQPARMKRKRLAMTVLTVTVLRFARTAGTRSRNCDKTWGGSSNRTCRIFGSPGNHIEGTILLWSTVLTHLSDNTDSGFCSPSRSVYARPKFVKYQAPNHLSGEWAKSDLPQPLPIIFKICTVQIIGQFWLDLDKKIGYPPFKLAGRKGRLHKLDSTDTGPHAPKCCLIQNHQSHSVVLLMSMASSRPVYNISRFVCMGC